MQRTEPMSTISDYSLKIKTKIANAIERSKAHNEIVRTTIEGTIADALSSIEDLTDCETDYEIHDSEGIDRMDIWGFVKDAKDGDMLWRLTITFLDESD